MGLPSEVTGDDDFSQVFSYSVNSGQTAEDSACQDMKNQILMDALRK